MTGVEAEIYVPERQQNLAFGVMDILTELLKDNEQNASKLLSPPPSQPDCTLSHFSHEVQPPSLQDSNQWKKQKYVVMKLKGSKFTQDTGVCWLSSSLMCHKGAYLQTYK